MFLHVEHMLEIGGDTGTCKVKYFLQKLFYVQLPHNLEYMYM